jgi:hypothetical protein
VIVSREACEPPVGGLLRWRYKKDDPAPHLLRDMYDSVAAWKAASAGPPMPPFST